MAKHHSKILDNYNITLECDKDSYKDIADGIRSIIEESIESSGTIDSDYFGLILKLNLERFWRGDGAKFPWDCLVEWQHFILGVVTTVEVKIIIKNFMISKCDMVKFKITKKI